jgi:hypothetical protein
MGLSRAHVAESVAPKITMILAVVVEIWPAEV